MSFMSFFRFIFSALDFVIYNLMGSIYELLMKIANVEIFSNGTLRAFSERIYALLGIFMAFKLIFTFINYVVNPDSMSDQKTGGKQLVVSIMVSLVLLIAVPSILFPLSRQFQKAILTEGVLQEVILGIDSTTYKESMSTRNAARNLSYSVLSGFIYPNASVCKPSQMDFYEDAEAPTSYKDMDADPNNGGKPNYRYKLDGNCATAINEGMGADAEATVLEYERAYNQKSVKALLADTIRTAKTKDGVEIFDYTFLISTIVGGFVTWILFGFCFHVAVRTIKLGFLELIAPIPILSYIDPKTRQKSFNGWGKSVIGTYLDLFVRLGAINFAILIVSMVTKPGALKYTFVPEGGDSTVGPLVMVFIIVGALMFAEQIPKLIEEVTGLKMDGKFSLNPLKNSKFASSVVGGAIGAVGGGALGMVGNVMANRASQRNAYDKFEKENENDSRYMTGGEKDKDKLWNAFKQTKDYRSIANQVGSAAGGLSSGMLRSAGAGFKSKKGFEAVGKGVAASSNARRARAGGYGTMQKNRDKMTDMFGMETASGTTGILKDEIKRANQEIENLKQREESVSRAMSQVTATNVMKSKSYLDAFAEDSSGKLKTESYEKYIRHQLEGTTFASDLDDVMTSDSLSDADRKLQIQGILDRATNARAIDKDTIISNIEYENYAALRNERNAADEASKKLEKVVKQKEEVQTMGKGGKKDK